ncbi:S8 family serine peptidase [Actinoplanes sp. KI2]|uniref:S8 family serine peptidase n=1 Tax=Actinoplanes sp. KI2 TaxID=2983315 RepID=UPI00295005EF|nr:S8 family serine peptidase [Actinoplanes sp. KI2]
MRLRILAATGATVLAAVVATPPSPAVADGTRDAQWYLKTLQILRAHAITEGVGVTVAVVDSGTYPHPDLRRNLLTGATTVTGETGNGQDDNSGHGTNMAAVIASHGRGGDGVLGIAPSAKILPIKVENTPREANKANLGKGIEQAVTSGADVINVSVGTGPDPDIEDAVADALTANIVVVAAVGNAPQSAIIDYPAAIAGVLVVGATGMDGKHASFSIDDSKVQLCAPGEKIRTAEPKTRYVDSTGTSPATAIVSGAAALVRAKFPELSAREVVHRLTATADDIGPPGRDKECGFGELNIVKALTADVPPLAGAASAATPTAGSVGSGRDGYLDPGATAVTPPAAQVVSNGAPRTLLVVLGGLVIAGGVVGFLVLWRRRLRR